MQVSLCDSFNIIRAREDRSLCADVRLSLAALKFVSAWRQIQLLQAAPAVTAAFSDIGGSVADS